MLCNNKHNEIIKRPISVSRPISVDSIGINMVLRLERIFLVLFALGYASVVWDSRSRLNAHATPGAPAGASSLRSALESPVEHVSTALSTPPGPSSGAAGKAAGAAARLQLFDGGAIPLTPEDFEAAGRRLECLALVASEVARVDAMTLVRPPRRAATVFLATEALKVPGDFVEAGVYTGGTAILMNAVLSCNNATGRRLWLADSFQGLPDPSWHAGDSEARGKQVGCGCGHGPCVLFSDFITQACVRACCTDPLPAFSPLRLTPPSPQEMWEHLSKKWTASQKQLLRNFVRFGTWYGGLERVADGKLGAWAPLLLPPEPEAAAPTAEVERAAVASTSTDSLGSSGGDGGGGTDAAAVAPRVNILAGWFRDTLPGAPVEAVSFLRCDADMYSSTLECLQFMYPRLSVGGLVYIDDYHEFEACR